MGKRFYLGVGILIFLLAVGLLVSFAMDRALLPISESLETAAKMPDAAQGEETARGAKVDWDRIWNRVALAADHTPMDEIDSLFAQMEVCDEAQFPGYCARIAELLEAVAEAHRLNLWNLL